MSIALVEALEEAWRSQGVFDAVEAALSRIGFTAEYVESLGDADRNEKTKVIKDGVWGMIEVDAASIRLLDSPVLQRLRWIKQLGLSYLTYPSAEHTRFIHSLGMFCVVSRFLEVIERRDTGSAGPEAPFSVWQPDATQARLLTHAAILHDIGHMPFSHVTESIMHADRTFFRCGPMSVDDFVFAAEDALRRSPKLAECLSLAIVLSPRFVRFYQRWVQPGATAADLRRIAALIAGVAPDPGLTGLANLISGPSIDSDKIDYIKRDAEACGIPVGVDVSRLFLRSSFLNLRPAEIQRLRSLATTPGRDEVVFVVNASGLDSIEEIGQARTSLYHRVYLHQTTRNAERLLSKAVYAAAEKGQFVDALDVWSLDDAALLQQLAGADEPGVARLGSRARSRQFPKRACAFGRNLCGLSIPFMQIFPGVTADGYKRATKQVIGNALDDLRSKRLYGEGLRRLERDIQEETARLGQQLRGTHPVSDSPLELISVLPMPNVEANRSECIILENKQLSSTAASSISDEQMEAADIVKSAGYVMCDRAWQDLAFVAARKTLYSKKQPLLDIAFSPHAGVEYVVKAEGRINLDIDAVVRRVGLDKDSVDTTIRAAARIGYFDEYPSLVPVSIDEGDLAAAAVRLAAFDGQGGWSVTTDTVRSFVQQFPERVRTELVTLLLRIRLLDRERLSTLIQRALAQVPVGTGRKFLVGLSPDSGNSVRTLLQQELSAQLGAAGWTFMKTLRDALSEASNDDTLVLIDDNATSGSQAICQFLAWTGVDKATWTEDQRNERGIEHAALSRRDALTLRSIRLGFVTALGTETARAALAGELPKLGLQNFLGLHYGDELVETSTISEELEDHLRSVGTSVLAWARFGERHVESLNPEQLASCSRDALGYRNAKALLATPLNVPVGTLTALWCPGFHRNEPWTPLMIRRGYLDKLIIA